MKGSVIYMVNEFYARLRMDSAYSGALFLVGVRL